MDAWIWVLVIVVAVLVLVALWLALSARRRAASLRDRFGPEYERTVERAGGRRAAEAELDERARQRERFDVRPLAPAARQRYAQAWQQVQAHFVDRPDDAVDEADVLVAEVMRERGYPVEDFESRAALVSVDHPDVVENYRAPHAVQARNAERLADTDELRRALHYRALFDELLGDDADAPRHAGQR